MKILGNRKLFDTLFGSLGDEIACNGVCVFLFRWKLTAGGETDGWLAIGNAWNSEEMAPFVCRINDAM